MTVWMCEQPGASRRSHKANSVYEPTLERATIISEVERPHTTAPLVLIVLSSLSVSICSPDPVHVSVQYIMCMYVVKPGSRVRGT